MTAENECGRITELLIRMKRGDQSAASEIAPIIYSELRTLAHHRMRNERRNHTLQTTALVHEVYMRLMGGQQISFGDRAHFFAAASGAMRHVLTDYARSRKAKKRGGDYSRVELSNVAASSYRDSWDYILDLNKALDKLATLDARQARVVELKFFAELEIPEIAQILDVSERTVKRDWQFAQAWLYKQIAGSSEEKDSKMLARPVQELR